MFPYSTDASQYKHRIDIRPPAPPPPKNPRLYSPLPPSADIVPVPIMLCVLIKTLPPEEEGGREGNGEGQES